MRTNNEDKNYDSKYNEDDNNNDIIELTDEDTLMTDRVQSLRLNKPELGLNLYNLDADEKLPSNLAERPEIQEEELQVIFDLPDGSQGEEAFKRGQTVEVLKSFIESEYGIPMEEQRLYLDDKLMMNPLSLLDYPEVKGCDEIFVRVEGYLPKFSKK